MPDAKDNNDTQRTFHDCTDSLAFMPNELVRRCLCFLTYSEDNIITVVTVLNLVLTKQMDHGIESSPFLFKRASTPSPNVSLL